MDAQMLHNRLAAAEGALIKIDERLDAIPTESQETALIACTERIAALEGTLAECIAQLQTLQSSTSETEAQIATAEADLAQAEAVEAIAEALEAQAELTAATEPEEEVMVEEIQPELEPESEVGPAKTRSSNWLERLLVLH